MFYLAIATATQNGFRTYILAAQLPQPPQCEWKLQWNPIVNVAVAVTAVAPCEWALIHGKTYTLRAYYSNITSFGSHSNWASALNLTLTLTLMLERKKLLLITPLSPSISASVKIQSGSAPIQEALTLTFGVNTALRKWMHCRISIRESTSTYFI